MARHEQAMASRNRAPQLHALLPIPGRNRRLATRRLGIINRLQFAVPACLRLLQVRAKDTSPNEIPPSCEFSSCGCLKCSTLCVIGWKIIRVTRSVYWGQRECAAFKAISWPVRPYGLVRKRKPGLVGTSIGEFLFIYLFHINILYIALHARAIKKRIFKSVFNTFWGNPSLAVFQTIK